MKGDLSRHTFQSGKHYRSVRMQQGRVQLDADWNEQVDIATHRVETEAYDVIGDAGGPLADAGFALTRTSDTDFTIGAGRYYVDGILVQNESPVPYSAQPDHPGRAALVASTRYLVYLDVWQRHVTHLDDPYLREVALGGPDTATRARTVWQVKVATPAGGVANCVDAWDAFAPPLPASGKLRAGTAPDTVSDNPCLVRPSAGYRGLENQLYRVEIHRPGAAFDLGPAPAIAVQPVSTEPRQLKVTSGAWAVGDAVQIVSTAEPDRGPVFLVTDVTAVSGGTTLGLSAEVLGVTFDANTRIRALAAGAVFKWSRDNGAIVTRLKAIDALTRTKLEVESLGPDDVLGFRDGDLVEISDDHDDLGGSEPGRARPGIILQIKKVDPGTRTLELVAAVPAAFVLTSQRNPKVRKWNGLGAVVYETATLDAATGDRNWVEIELGLRVRFTKDGDYRTGDYWQIAARASNADGRSGNIEWTYPEPDQRPFGIEHHFCPLAVIDLANGDPALQIEDCRDLFPPLTELKHLFFVGGDGQEVMPDLTDPTQLVQLPHPLVVGVVNGLHSVVGARVQFMIEGGAPFPGGDRITAGAAQATGLGSSLITTTGSDGMALCTWSLRAGDTGRRRVSARLLDHADVAEDVPPILFGANLSVASEVAFAPPADCPPFVGQKTVQAAIEALAHVRTLQAIGGDGQDGPPNAMLTLPIEVEVRDHCGPVENQQVTFSVPIGELFPLLGASGATVDVVTDGAGRARVMWQLGSSVGPQEATATLRSAGTPEPSVRFTANAVRNEACGERVVHSEAQLITLAADPQLVDAHICIVPGTFRFEGTVEFANKGHLKVSGAGDGTRLEGLKIESVLRFSNCRSVTIRDLQVATVLSEEEPHEGGALEFKDCPRVTLEHLRVSSSNGRTRSAACISVSNASGSLRIRSCDLGAGDGHIGIRAVDVARAELEDNTISAFGRNRGFRSKLLDDARFVEGVRKYLMHDFEAHPLDQPPPPPPPPVPTVRGLYFTSLPNRLRAALNGDTQEADRVLPFITRGSAEMTLAQGWQMVYEAPRALLAAWQQILRAHPPAPPLSRSRIERHVRTLGRRILKEYLAGGGDLLLAPFREALDRLAREDRVIGAQGIVVGGSVRGEARILNNDVRGFAQGIHVGHSNSKSNKTFRSARTLAIGNSVHVRVNGHSFHDRHGVFSGNSENTIIENNAVTADRSTMALDLPLEAYRVYGILGPLLKVHQNQAVDCSVGVRVHALNPASQPASVWRVHDNAVRGTLTPFDITPPMP